MDAALFSNDNHLFSFSQLAHVNSNELTFYSIFTARFFLLHSFETQKNWIFYLLLFLLDTISHFQRCWHWSHSIILHPTSWHHSGWPHIHKHNLWNTLISSYSKCGSQTCNPGVPRMLCRNSGSCRTIDLEFKFLVSSWDVWCAYWSLRNSALVFWCFDFLTYDFVCPLL